MRPQSNTILTRLRAYNWSNPQRVAEKRKIYNCLLLPGANAVADKIPAITKPKGNVLTPQGINNKIPESNEVPTHIFNIISNTRIVMAAINKTLVLPRCTWLSVFTPVNAVGLSMLDKGPEKSYIKD